MIHIPRESLWSVKEVCNEYDFQTIPQLFAPKVLDIGANVGIFALACVESWPSARIISFEPHPETAQILRHNVAGLPVEVYEAAVSDWAPESGLPLYEGKRNRLCCSLLDRGDQDTTRSHKVKTIPASELPACDLLKIDTEGSEVPILERYRHLSTVKVFLCELHGTKDQLFEDAERIFKLTANAGLVFLDQRGNTLRYTRSG